VNPRISSQIPVIVLALAASATASAGPAAAGKKETGPQEIQVTLFGQPCTMSGPFPRASLTLLHEISPEKLPPDITLEQMKRVRTKANELKDMPMPIEQYRDHLRKRLSAKITFEESFAAAKKSSDPKRALGPFLTNLKEHVSTLQYPAFVEFAKKAFDSAGGVWNEAFLAPLRERFENVIQPDTEEEFHKAIRTAKIQYVCSFDEADHRGGEEDE
jgi:hypothetical protein